MRGGRRLTLLVGIGALSDVPLFLFGLPGHIDDATAWTEWTGMSTLAVVITGSIGFIIAGLLLWVIEHFQWRIIPQTRAQRVRDGLYPVIVEAVERDRASTADPLDFDKILAFQAQVEVVKMSMKALSLRCNVSNLQHWPMLLIQLEPFAKQGHVENIQAICDEFMADTLPTGRDDVP